MALQLRKDIQKETKNTFEFTPRIEDDTEKGPRGRPLRIALNPQKTPDELMLACAADSWNCE